ncbi:Serine--tRNA ligase [Babesia sp. Xinjiang]|uniref:Serine--tRNA ligase n=1 Tax=Babesia sp. Xinjiang TaxID=462227 RepID=UPI000A2573C6|nr:Serine--tRNA ligase [Babesia sp. Xinjiang]ORM40617.1 Serine--tRNA ligase [Babesia sp. Xinjiang]
MCILRFLALALYLFPSSIGLCHGHCTATWRGLPAAYLLPKRVPTGYKLGRLRSVADKVETAGTSGLGHYSVSSVNLCQDSCLTAISHDLEERLAAALRDGIVLRAEADGNLIPNSFDLTAVASVPELFHANFCLRKEDHSETLLKIHTLYFEKVSKKEELDALLARRSELSKDFHKSADPAQASLRECSLALRNEVKCLQSRVKTLDEQLSSLLCTLPNIVSEGVPETEVIVEKTSNGSAAPDTPGTIVPHYEIIERFSDVFTSKSTRISGTGFSAFSGNISRLERALSNFMLDTHHKLFGYKEVSVPFIVNEHSLESTGHLPRFEDDLFKLDERHQCNGERGYLIPTGEIPLLALLGNSRIHPDRLPLWLMAYTPCFRSEIQDYGRETRGLIRNHQFGKVELVCVCDSGSSEHFHNLMLSHIEFILKSLGLPYRRVLLPVNQLGATSSKTVDFEVFFPSLDKYIEVSSCSNTLDYQSNRLNLLTSSRSKVHCINGSGLALGRTLSAILENYQLMQKNNRLAIRVPDVLKPYLNGEQELIEPTLSGKVMPSNPIKTHTPEVQAKVESDLFSVVREAWLDSRVPRVQKFVTGTFLSILFGGGIASKYYDQTNSGLSRSIIIGETHLLSSYLAFTCGLRSGLMHYLGCGIIPRRFYWAPHYMQISSVSGVLAAAFASGNADVSSRTVLRLLGGCFTLCAANEVLATRFNMSPRWYVSSAYSKNNGWLVIRAHIGVASVTMASGFSGDEISSWAVLYPTYFDKKASVSGGRRVNQSLAVENPRVEDIRAVCAKLKVPYVLEPNKLYPRDYMNPGRIRVYFLHPNAESKATTKCTFIYEIAPLIAQLKSCQKSVAPATNSAKSTKKKKK